MTEQDYRITSFKVGTFKDDHNNTWCDMALEGFGEPVRVVLKDPSKFATGDTIYGRIEQKTSKANKAYWKFQRVMKDEPQYVKTNNSRPAWTPRDDSHIRAQWAIGQAVSMHADDEAVKGKDFIAGGNKNLFAIEATAKELFAMVDRVKDSTTPAAAPVTEEHTIATEAGDSMEEEIDLSQIPF